MDAAIEPDVDLNTGFELAPGYHVKFSGEIIPGKAHLLVASNARGAQIVYECRRPKVLTTFHLPMHDGKTTVSQGISYRDIAMRMPFANFAVREEFFTDFGGPEDGVLLTARGVDDIVLFKVPHGSARLISYAAKSVFTGNMPEKIAAPPLLRTVYHPDLKADPKNSSLNMIGRLYNFLYNRKYRFIEKHVNKRERRRLDLPDEYSEFIVIGPEDFRYANAIRPNDIAYRMRELHADPVWVRGHMRTYRHMRYVNVRGESSFIESHKRGEGEPEPRAYYVGGAMPVDEIEEKPKMRALTTADGKPMFNGMVIADKRLAVADLFESHQRRTYQVEDVMHALNLTRPQAEWACENMVQGGFIERVGTYRYRYLKDFVVNEPTATTLPVIPADAAPDGPTPTPEAVRTTRSAKRLREDMLRILSEMGEPMTVRSVFDLLESADVTIKQVAYHLERLLDHGLVTRTFDDDAIGRPLLYALKAGATNGVAPPEPPASSGKPAPEPRKDEVVTIVPAGDFASVLRAQIASMRASIEDGEKRFMELQRQSDEVAEQVKSLRDKLAHMEALL